MILKSNYDNTTNIITVITRGTTAVDPRHLKVKE